MINNCFFHFGEYNFPLVAATVDTMEHCKSIFEMSKKPILSPYCKKRVKDHFGCKKDRIAYL